MKQLKWIYRNLLEILICGAFFALVSWAFTQAIIQENAETDRCTAAGGVREALIAEGYTGDCCLGD